MSETTRKLTSDEVIELLRDWEARNGNVVTRVEFLVTADCCANMRLDPALHVRKVTVVYEIARKNNAYGE